MKNLKPSYPCSLFKILIILFFLSTTGCRDLVRDEVAPIDAIANYEATQWYEVLDQLDLGPKIIVQNGESIQKAVDAALPGDAIYIEPGIYQEAIVIDKSDLKLIGLGSADDMQVVLDNSGGLDRGIEMSRNVENVEIDNIQVKNLNETRTYSSRRSPARKRRGKSLLKMTRVELAQGIAHYKFEVRMGPGQFDVVGIHRLVREYRPYRPDRTNGAIFMVHGSSQDFLDIYLRSGASEVTSESSIAMYLASNGIDVWGIDLAWTRVPAETVDFSFMKDWGMERDVDHTLSAMSIARIIRGLTRQGFGRINLLGFSYSVPLVYAAAGRETQQHRICRDIRGIVPVDAVMKYAAEDESARLIECLSAKDIKDQMDNGIYHSQFMLGIFGQLAVAAPDDPSPIIPGFTNYQASLFIGTNTFALGPFPTPFWHFVGGDFNEFGIPVGLLYTDPDRWISLLAEPSAGPFMPQQVRYDLSACWCDEEDVKIDDHFTDIRVPTLFIGAGGGWGTTGEYSTSLLASSDVTNYTLKLQPDNQMLDYGHGDLFLGENAGDLIWEVLRQWLVEHNSHKYM